MGSTVVALGITWSSAGVCKTYALLYYTKTSLQLRTLSSPIRNTFPAWQSSIAITQCHKILFK